MSRIHFKTYVDPDFGAIALALNDEGEVVASASSGIEGGTHTAVDEGAFYATTGRLLPMQVWEAAILDDEDPPPRPV